MHLTETHILGINDVLDYIFGSHHFMLQYFLKIYILEEWIFAITFTHLFHKQ